MTKLRAIFTREVRAWIYGIAVAAGGITAIYGVTTQEEVAVWLILAGAVLVPNGLAMANLERDREPDR